MSKLVRMPSGGDATWNALGGAAQSATPSWLAPPCEAASPPVNQPSRPPAEAKKTYAPPSIRVAADPDASHVELPAASRATVAPAYPDLQEENALLRAQLEGQGAVLAELRRAILVASEPDLVRLACVVAERIVGRELTLDPTLFVAWARQAVDELAKGDDLSLSISPDLAALVSDTVFRDALASLASVDVDASLGPMRCEARTRVSRVTAGLEERLATVAEELGVPRE